MEKLTRSQVKYMVARARSEKRLVLFQDVDLSGVNLENLDLRKVTFRRVKLYDTVFNRSDLRNATFMDCDLTRANFSFVDARNIHIRWCVFDPERWRVSDTCRLGSCER